MPAIAILVPACADPTTTHRNDHELLLEEVAAVGIPREFPPSGAQIGNDGDVVVWSAGRTELLLVSLDGTLRYLTFGSNESPTAAGFVDSAPEIEVLIGITGRIVTIRRDGTLAAERFVMEWIDSGSVQAGVRTTPGWVFAVGDTTGRIAVAQEDIESSPRVLAQLDVDRRRLPDSMLRPSVHLTATDTAVLISQWWPPFISTVLTVLGEPVGELRPAGRPYKIDLDSLAQSSAWVGMPALFLDQGYIQTLSDLRGDGRWLILFDSAGNEIRRTHVDVPLALVATLPHKRLLIGFRRTDMVELVAYKWKWRARS